MQALLKPYKEYPLTPHPLGYWVKVIHGKQHRFGTRWCSPDEALNAWYKQKDDLLNNREPVVEVDGLTLRDGLRLFLESRLQRLKEGALCQRSYDEYYAECKRTRDILGANIQLTSIGPSHFTLLLSTMAGLAPNTIATRVTVVRVLFKFLFEAGYLDKPVRYGTEFNLPSAAVIRKHRASKPKKLFTPAQIHALLKEATPQMKACIYLGLFAGFGNTDVALVQPMHFEGQWVTYPRPKTGIQRRAWLPPEALKALKAAMPIQTTAKRVGYDFTKMGTDLTFYALRHTTETIGGRAKDQIALDHIQGHVSGQGMSSVYRKEVTDDRLNAIGDVINEWLGRPPKGLSKRT